MSTLTAACFVTLPRESCFITGTGRLFVVFDRHHASSLRRTSGAVAGFAAAMAPEGCPRLSAQVAIEATGVV
jgi:hypothetical protein